MSYKKNKKDKNHQRIVEHLRIYGVWVVEGHPPQPDLIIYKRRIEMAFLEIKRGSKSKYTKMQLEFISTCVAPVGIVTNEDDAYKFALYPTQLGLTQRQKDNIYMMIQLNPDRKFFTPKEFQKCL